jgi:RNA polymerase-binding transcription factor DksA
VDTQEARQSLEQMLREIDSATAILEAEGAGDSSELSHSDQHPGDTASELTDADNQNALLDNSAQQRAEVEAPWRASTPAPSAPASDCGQPIPDARLEVRPEAARCVEDQGRYEAANS